MREYIRRLNSARLLAYLETDKPENVTFSHRHGFVVRVCATVLGNPNWFMHRGPERFTEDRALGHQPEPR